MRYLLLCALAGCAPIVDLPEPRVAIEPDLPPAPRWWWLRQPPPPPDPDGLCLQETRRREGRSTRRFYWNRLEPQPSLIHEARRRSGRNQTFVEAPAQQVAAALPADLGTFDVVMSRSVLHWIPWPDHRSILEQCRLLLSPGGVLRVECGGGDNVREVVRFLDDLAAGIAGDRAVRAPWNFVHAGAYLDLLLETGFVVEDGFVRTVAQRRSFDRESVLGWLHSQVAQAYEVGLRPDERARLRAAVDQRVDELRRPDGTYDLTFVRLDFLVHAPARRSR